MALSQDAYEQVWADIQRGERNGHALVKDGGFELYVSRDPATCLDTQTFVIRYSDDTPDERLTFRNADGVRLHAGGA